MILQLDPCLGGLGTTTLFLYHASKVTFGSDAPGTATSRF